ncbi:hypothetical protein CKM354_000661900 [Cercospora kikuchii]|uniref:Uncharacterized protein n=1 Tax=Cercospora kikuchii TaxID=84275 RepID=A0A9P3CIJ1_9PEZI|nr:uncharacterized protein CKM354_000661900 [Cercospora kikuchii]GIZ43391.1 hypothetical protein CKM354_000661900 [Cercospora kikuchii]
MAPYNDPNRERAFQKVLTDISASQKKRDGRYEDLAAQLDSLAENIEEHQLLIKPLGKPVSTPSAEQLRKMIMATFGGIEVFTAPMQALTAKQKEQYLESPSPELQTPRKLTAKERTAKDQANRESPLAPFTLTGEPSEGTAKQSGFLVEASTTDVDGTRPTEVVRKASTKIRLHAGKTQSRSTNSMLDRDASREIANSQGSDVSLNEHDSGAKKTTRGVVDLSDDAADLTSTHPLPQDIEPQASSPGKKRKAVTSAEGEEQRRPKKRVLVEGERRSNGEGNLDTLVSGTKRSADAALDEDEHRVAKRRTLLDQQADTTTESELGLIGRGKKRKAEAVQVDAEQLPNKRSAQFGNEPRSIETSLATENKGGRLGPTMTDASQLTEKQDANHGAAGQHALQLARENDTPQAGVVASANEGSRSGGSAGLPSAPAQAATITDDPLSPETMRKAKLGLGPKYPFDLRQGEDLPMQVASMMSKIRTIASIIDEDTGLTKTPPSLMPDPDRTTSCLYERMFCANNASWRDNANIFLSKGSNTVEVLLSGLIGAALYDRVWSQPLPWQTAQDFLAEWSDALPIAHDWQQYTQNKLPLEFFIFQISADRLKDESDFDLKRIQPLAREHAESVFMSLIPQLRHMNARLNIQDRLRQDVLELLTELFANALKVRGRLEAAPADYEYIWPHSGTEFERWRMKEVRGHDQGGNVVERTMACLIPAIRMQDPARIMTKAQVFGC